MIDWGKQVQNSHFCKIWYTERKKLTHFDIKNWITGGTKIWPGQVDNWRIYLSQIDSTLRIKLTQHWESNCLNIQSQIDSKLRFQLTQHIESQIDSTLRVKLTQHWESNWLNIESQIDSTLRVKLTQIFSSYTEKHACC